MLPTRLGWTSPQRGFTLPCDAHSQISCGGGVGAVMTSGHGCVCVYVCVLGVPNRARKNFYKTTIKLLKCVKIAKFSILCLSDCLNCKIELSRWRRGAWQHTRSSRCSVHQLVAHAGEYALFHREGPSTWHCWLVSEQSCGID